MTSEQLAVIAGIVLSLGFSYVPGLSAWYGGLGREHKQIIMAWVLAVAAGSVYGLACVGDVIDVAVTCDKAGAVGLAMAFVNALIANQATYLITRRAVK